MNLMTMDFRDNLPPRPSFRDRLKRSIRSIPRAVKPLYRAWRKGRELKVVFDRTGRIQKDDILLFATLRNEAWRMPFFVNYYRRLGVNHFFFVDNDSTDDFQTWASTQEDCSLWHTDAGYKDSMFGMDWLNSLLWRHGDGHWCITCDPDEFLVFPYCEDRDLSDFVRFLSEEKINHVFCLMLDMYGRGSVKDTNCALGQDPLEVAPYYDGSGYVQNVDAYHETIFIQGGVRRRVFCRDDPWRAPALNKVPLVRWKRGYAYTSSMHLTSWWKLNRPHGRHEVRPTGCLLHFKFLSAVTQKVVEEMQRNQHYDNSYEYRKYNELLAVGADELFCEISLRYSDTAALMKQGLMHAGLWL